MISMTDNNVYLKAKDVAADFFEGKVRYVDVLEMTKKGDLPAVKVGRRFLYLRSALEEWRNKNFYSPVWQKVKVKI